MSTKKGVNVDHALVIRKPILFRDTAFGIELLNPGTQPSQFISTISEWYLRKEQKQEND